MYDVKKGPGFLEIQLTATLENVDRAETETREFLHRSNEKWHAFKVLLLMREALNNTIRPVSETGSLIVKYGLKIQSNVLCIQVEDSGPGFDWKMEMDKAKDSSASHGRGLSIMKKYSTGMIYNDKGNALTLVINLSEIG